MTQSDPRPSWFASGGSYDKAVPDAGMAGALEAVTDASGRPSLAASDDEVAGMLGCWQAIEAHAHARVLAAMREIIRRRVPEGESPAVYQGELPARWDIGVAHEVAAQLRISWQAAVPLVQLAWELEARLPDIGRLLDAGVLTALKAKIVADEFAVLSDDKIVEAQERLLEEDLAADEMTPGRLRKTCQRLADTVDPDGARRRREEAARDRARVTFYRAHGGDTAMFAEGLPPDKALMAQANIQARALDCKKAMVYPEAGMDLLRVLALLDLVNGISLDQRIAEYHAEHAADEDARNAAQRAADAAAREKLGTRRPVPPARGETSGSETGGAGGGSGSGGVQSETSGSGSGLPALTHLTLPLATLLRLAERPGEAPGYGSIDPGLVRDLARAAAASPRTQFCLTITDSHGHAAAHGCARLIRDIDTRRRTAGTQDGPAAASQDGPAEGSRDGPAASGGWSLAPGHPRSEPDGGYGTWILSVPGGRRYRLDLRSVPVHDCDHRYATDSYRPSDLLRHLVQVRDGECTFTGCSHPADRCDFEHARPHEQGGITDACNAGARSRRCHRVKQSQGWSVTQPEPGRHRWTTPSGRAFIKEAKRYPA